ncbi:MAG: DNA polymerase III subunit epsilon [Sphingobium sp.]|jgi:DNA polymerase-3 subunit epsilon|uniref:DNA polymerase III subunit epsilon n=1 Tax=Sphingobium sp. TaxID=1912891 RepID=UPI000DB13008|nr:DNA polymerase III subunit epsilon [Sphingobium sp.]PZU14422.1 MAG: DNA polymerase III subunit epsilon [Sphingobium sp.]
MREVIFDTETTGFDPASGDRMVEIGCIELINRVPTGRTFHAYYHPERDMPAGAFAVHGLSADFLAKHPVFAKGALDLLAFLEDSPLVAHNARFDFGFLNHELRLCGHPEVAMDRMIDTVAIARQMHPGAKHSLDALCTRYGIDRSHRIKHGALLDAELLAQLYIELTGGRQIGLGLGQEEDKEIVRVELTADAVVRPVRPARVFAASAAELERHAAFIATLKEPLWLQEA